MIQIVIALLSFIGLTISAYFTAVAYRWMRADQQWIPDFCRMGEQTCTSVVFSRQAWLLGPPNSVLGLLFYAGLLAAAVTGMLLSRPWIYGWLALTTGTVLMGGYLAYSLLFVLRVPCRLCFAAHGINLLILILLLVGLP